jgi:GT2 family glycosyltransferase
MGSQSIEEIEAIGVVVIGRNEGERLKGCLKSLVGRVKSIVYVDSGSSDGSLEYAQSLGVDVVSLDMTIPFSAGRARNEGFEQLRKHQHELTYVQFIDGDCEVAEGWLTAAHDFLEKETGFAVVAGRRHEKFPERSVYNQLCDIEWDTPVGETEVCGGDFMIRAETFAQVKGFNPSVVAGEEPDMCYRLRKQGWKIFRLDHSMTHHDAAITRFSQWWRRTVRCGHAYAQGYDLHRSDGEGYCLRLSIKSWIWALVIPVMVLVLTLTGGPLFLLLLGFYPLQFIKITRDVNQRLKSGKLSAIYAIFTVLAKWPQLIGQMLFVKRKLMGKKPSIIEYN